MKQNKLIVLLSVIAFVSITFFGYKNVSKLSHIENENHDEFEPNEEFLLQRTYPNKSFDIAAYQKALVKAHSNQNSLTRAASTVSWQLEGPGNIGGRFNCLTVDPTNSSIMYAGSANGGLWKTTDNGVSWNPMTDALPYQAIGAIAINPSNSNEIWIGMGDANISGTMYTGDGVYKSTNGGTTWNSIGLANTYVVSGIKFNSANPNEVLVTTMGNPFNKDGNRGIYKTTDGGMSFTNKLFVNDSTGIIDIVQHPTNPSIVYASSFTRLRTDRRSLLSGTQNYVYKSTDFGQTWNILAGGLPNGISHERIGITLCESNPSILYALYSTSDGTSPQLYKSINSGSTWSLVNFSSFDNSAYGTFGWYFGKIYVDKNNPNLVYMPGVDLQYSTDGGVTWNMRTPIWWTYDVHADGHNIFFNSSNDIIYCTDGGLYRTTDGGVNWFDIENIPVNQFYSITENINLLGEYAGGVQDNGTMNGNASTINSFNRIYGGDGFKVEYTHNPNLLYTETQNGNIVYNDFYPTGGWNDISMDPSQNYNWFTPYFVSPHDESTLFFAGETVMRIDGAPYGSYISISPNLNNPSSPARVKNISTINQSKITSQKLFAGTAAGKVWNTLDYGVTWNDITPFTGLSYYVTQVLPSPNFTSNVYVTRSGYRSNDNTPLIFKSINDGATWTNISGDLPALAVNDIEVLPGDENVIFIANDAGVYYTINAGVNWIRLGNNMPYVAVLDIKLNSTKSKLIAGTFGRSMYTIDLTFLSTAINEIANSTIDCKVYPNPTSDFLSIKSTSEISYVKIVSIDGKELMKTRSSEYIDISAFPKGNYFAIINTNGKDVIKKFVIE